MDEITDLNEQENGITNEIHKVAVGLWNTEKMLAGTLYAGTNTKEEVAEVAKHIRDMVSTGLYSFADIEKKLLADGYSSKLIRSQFKVYTGVSVQDIDKENCLARTTPAGVPSINLGWGHAKGKGQTCLFIMPWHLGYAVFEQKSPIERSIVQTCADPDDLHLLRDFVQKKCKDYFEANKPIQLKIQNVTKEGESEIPMNEQYFTEVRASLSPSALSILEAAMGLTDERPDARTAYLNSCYTEDLLTTDEFNKLSSLVRVAAEVEDAGLVNVQTERPEIAKLFENAKDSLDHLDISTELQEATPMDFMHNTMEAQQNTDISKGVLAVEGYFRVKSAQLEGKFKFSIHSFKYLKLERVDSLIKNIEMDKERPLELLRSSATIVALLRVKRAGDESEDRGQIIMVTFLLVGGKYFTPGTFKGTETDKKYAFDEDGLEAYFNDAGSPGK